MKKGLMLGLAVGLVLIVAGCGGLFGTPAQLCLETGIRFGSTVTDIFGMRLNMRPREHGDLRSGRISYYCSIRTGRCG